MAGRPGRARAAPADRAVRQGGAGADARPPGRALPRHPARRAPAAHARTHRAQAGRPADGRAAGRLRPVPSGSRPALDRHDRSQARRAGGSGHPGGDPGPRKGCGPDDCQQPEHVPHRGARGRQVVRPDARPAGGQRAGGRRGDPGRDGPERVGQVDAAALPGRHLPARRGRDLVRRPAARPDGRDQADRAAAHRVRLRVPVRAAGAGADRGGQHRAAAAARPGPPQGGVPDGGAVAGPARPGRQGRPAQRRAVRRRGAAGGDRAGAGDRPQGAVRRRADRIARLAGRGEGDGPADRPGPGAGRDRGPGHPRRPGRRLRRPPGRWCATARSPR